jgi:hypothetical protein
LYLRRRREDCKREVGEGEEVEEMDGDGEEEEEDEDEVNFSNKAVSASSVVSVSDQTRDKPNGDEMEYGAKRTQGRTKEKREKQKEEENLTSPRQILRPKNWWRSSSIWSNRPEK